MSTDSRSGLGSSGCFLSSVNCQPPCAAPSIATCTISAMPSDARISFATAIVNVLVPRVRARLAATAAPRRMELRVTSVAFPMPTSMTRSALPEPYTSSVSSFLPL